jgi:hypothetical protein
MEESRGKCVCWKVIANATVFPGFLGHERRFLYF